MALKHLDKSVVITDDTIIVDGDDIGVCTSGDHDLTVEKIADDLYAVTLTMFCKDVSVQTTKGSYADSLIVSLTDVDPLY